MRKNNKVVISLCVLMCTGCFWHGTKPKTRRIGIVLYEADDIYLNNMMHHMQSLADTDQTEMTIADGDDLQSVQDAVVENMILDGVDVLCVNLVDRTAPSEIIRVAKEADIPVIFFNREPLASDLNRWSKLYYVGADAHESGRLQGQVITAYFKQHPQMDFNHDNQIQYYVLEGEPQHQDTIIRTETSVATLNQAGLKLDKVGYASANWQRNQAEEEILQLIDDGTNVELIISNNDEMAIGAVDAYEKAGIVKEKVPAIIGIDGTPAGLQSVKEQKLIGTVYNDYVEQANAIYQLACDLLDEKQASTGKQKYIWIPYEKVTFDNVDMYLEKE